jgi:hypothetical protein
VNNRYGGLITMVDNAGNIVWQNVYNPPVGSGLRVEFNCVTTQAGGAFDDLVVTGTIRSTNPLVPSSILWLSLSPNTGAINWSSRYMLTNGDDCEAFHHSEIVIASKNIVCAGRITHKSDGHTSAMLMEIIDRLHHQGLTCDSQVVWWRYYDTRDRKDSNDTLVFLNTELRDVVPIINGEIHDVAAIGTAERFHNGVRIKDLLWMETATNNLIAPPVFGLNNDGDLCKNYLPQWTCEDFPLDIEELKPILLPKIKIDETGLTDFQDLEYKTCDTTAPLPPPEMGQTGYDRLLPLDPGVKSSLLFNERTLNDILRDYGSQGSPQMIRPLNVRGIYNILGQCVMVGSDDSLTISDLNNMITQRSLSKGVYYCMIYNGRGNCCVKIVIP